MTRTRSSLAARHVRCRRKRARRRISAGRTLVVAPERGSRCRRPSTATAASRTGWLGGRYVAATTGIGSRWQRDRVVVAAGSGRVGWASQKYKGVVGCRTAPRPNGNSASAPRHHGRAVPTNMRPQLGATLLADVCIRRLRGIFQYYPSKACIFPLNTVVHCKRIEEKGCTNTRLRNHLVSNHEFRGLSGPTVVFECPLAVVEPGSGTAFSVSPTKLSIWRMQDGQSGWAKSSKWHAVSGSLGSTQGVVLYFYPATCGEAHCRNIDSCLCIFSPYPIPVWNSVGPTLGFASLRTAVTPVPRRADRRASKHSDANL